MALIAAHRNAGHSGGDSVAIGIYSPSFPTSVPPSPPFSPSLITLMVSVDVKHHVYFASTKTGRRLIRVGSPGLTSTWTFTQLLSSVVCSVVVVEVLLYVHKNRRLNC